MNIDSEEDRQKQGHQTGAKQQFQHPEVLGFLLLFGCPQQLIDPYQRLFQLPLIDLIVYLSVPYRLFLMWLQYELT